MQLAVPLASPYPTSPGSSLSKPAGKEVSARVLTVAAVCTPIGRHGTVAGEALPLLETHPLIGAGVLRAGCAGA